MAHIFEYLDDIDDLKSVTIVCKHWLKATQVAKVLKNYKLSFSFITIGSNEKQLALFANSERVFSNIYFGNAKFKSIDPDFWCNWSDYITEITFDYKFRTSDLPGGNFVELLKYTQRLKTLNLVCSLGLFNTYIDELLPQDRQTVLLNIKNVQELQMYFSEECLLNLEFGAWIDDLANVKNIDFDIHSKKSSIPSQAYFVIFNFLNKFSAKIKGLHICDHNRALNRSVAERLFAIKDMKLKALDLTINNATSKMFTDFLCTQTELMYLTVNGIFSLNRSLKHMPKLKEIAVSNGSPFDGFEVFAGMEKLESIGIAGLEFYNGGETYNFCTNSKLRELYLIDSVIDFSRKFVKRMCECFANIRLLNLDGAMIDDSSLVHVFKLKKLQELKLSKTEITDRGFVGALSRKKLKAADSQAVVPIHEHLSISSLKELEVLNIDFCKLLSSRSFNSMQLKKLKHLSAQGTNLSGSHMQSLRKNCPKIESLNLSKCNQLRENDVQAFMSLKQLETLELESCSKLEPVCLEYIMRSNSNKIQTLNFSKCFSTIPNVWQIADEMFSRMKSLRRIILHNERLYRCNYVDVEA